MIRVDDHLHKEHHLSHKPVKMTLGLQKKISMLDGPNLLSCHQEASEECPFAYTFVHKLFDNIPPVIFIAVCLFFNTLRCFFFFLSFCGGVT